MPKWRINEGYAGSRTVEADNVVTTEQFVDFVNTRVGDVALIVLRMRTTDLYVLEVEQR